MSVTRLLHAALLVFTCLALVGIAVPAQESVDFSKAPAAGLKYKTVSNSSSDGSQSVSFGENSMEATVKSEQSTTFTDSVVEVKEGKVTKMEREYEDINTKRVMETSGREPREIDRDSPLAWKHFRVEWNEDGEATVKVKDDDEWKDPEDGLKRRLRPKRMRRALFPLPREAKSVGDTWELSEKTIKAYFPVQRMRGRNGEEGPEIEREVAGNLEFAEIADYREMKCAVIKAELEIKTVMGEAGSTTTKLTQTCYYSLEHRIVVGIKGSTETEAKMSRERGETTVEMESTAKGTSETVVTIETVGKKEEGGE